MDTNEQLKTIIETMENSLKYVRESSVVNEFGYAYCSGYLEGTLSNVIYELKQLTKE